MAYCTDGCIGGSGWGVATSGGGITDEVRGVLAAGVITVDILGPFAVSVGGRPLVVPPGRLRTLLAVLAMSVGTVASVDHVAGAIWDEDLPQDCRASVQIYVHRLRRLLGDAAISTAPGGGYILRTGPDQVDARRFTRLVEAARAADPATERLLLAEALPLWRGTPFEGVRSTWLRRSETPALVERYLAAQARRIDLDISDGLHAAVVPQLHELTAQYPSHERFWSQLMLALYEAGRQVEALEVYQRLYRLLRDDHGILPSPSVRELHELIRAGRQPLAGQPGADAPRPRALPTSAADFSGRVDALRRLDALLPADSDHPGRATAVAVITGTPGVGKTTLAVCWAHLVADRFRDGQHYVDLRGFSPSGQPMSPAEAISGLLHALGTPPQQIPHNLSTQIGLYRSLLADRRVLILLDNAHDADQVRPLLPGAPWCMVLVTSRDQLTGLVAAEAAHPLILGPFSRDEAWQFMVRRIGAARVEAEPDAAAELAELCGHLALAMTIVAARAVAQPDLSLAMLATHLRAARGTLDALAGSDQSTDLRAVFSWSYRALSPDAARLFRLLGRAPGPDIAAAAAASLAGVPLPHVLALLAELCTEHLVAEHVPGRYTLHDLLRAYADEVAGALDTEADRHAALHRLLDHYLHTAYAGARLLNPHRDPIRLESAQPGVSAERFHAEGPAFAWFSAEQTVLLAAVDQSVALGCHSHTWQLAWALTDFLDRRGRWHDKAAVQRAALAATQRADARPDQARVHRDLGRTYTQLGSHARATTHLREALALYRSIGDDTGQAHTHINLVWLFEREKQHTEALDHAQHALNRYRAAGHRVGQANALNAIGWSYSLLGEHQEAIVHCRNALALLTDLGDRRGQADTWDSLGHIYRELSDKRQAVTSFRHALQLYRELGNRYYEGDTLVQLGDLHHASGNPAAARLRWRRALDIFDLLAHDDRDAVRARLDRLDGQDSAAGRDVTPVTSDGPVPGGAGGRA